MSKGYTRIKVVCTSVGEGMLMNPVSVELLNQLRTKTAAPKDRTISVEDEAMSKQILDDHGNLAVPTTYLWPCLIEAGRRVATGKGARQNVSTATGTLIFDFIEIESDNGYIPMVDPSEPLADLRRGCNPNDGVMVAIVRPLIRNWQLEFVMRVWHEGKGPKLNLAAARQLIEVAGSTVGLGDFRPAKRGPFGRFEVTAFETLEVVKGDVVEVEADDEAAAAKPKRGSKAKAATAEAETPVKQNGKAPVGASA